MKRYSVVILLLILIPFQTFALEVDREVMPRILLGGRVIASSYYTDKLPNYSQVAGIDLDDSAFLLGFDKRLFVGGVGGATIGIKNTHEGMVFHELNTFLWSKYFHLSLGKTRLRNTLIEFPTMRDDDLLDYTHVLNGETGSHLSPQHAIAADNKTAQIYGSTVAGDWYIDGKNQRIGIWSSERGGHGDFNTVGIGYVFELNENLRYVKRLRHAGILIDAQNVAHNDSWVVGVVSGLEFNLNYNPQNNLAFALQVIGVNGSQNNGVFTGYSDMAVQDSISVVSALKYTRRPLLLTRWVASLNLAYKNYTADDNATQWSVAPHLLYRLGQGVDVTTQLMYSRYNGVKDYDSEFGIHMGLSFALDTSFNNNIGARNSILNLEHGYIQ